jgi:hypothetical protein
MCTQNRVKSGFCDLTFNNILQLLTAFLVRISRNLSDSDGELPSDRS